jgi:hypothetical protein
VNRIIIFDEVEKYKVLSTSQSLVTGKHSNVLSALELAVAFFHFCD